MATRADFSFQVEGLDEDTLRVLKFEGKEGISESFEFDLELTSPDEVDFESVVGKPAVLQIHTDDEPRQIQGLVSRFEHTRQGRKLGFYRATLVPRLWVLNLCRRSRIFQDMKTDEILKDVMESMGVPEIEFALKRSYKPRLYCVQYRESDFVFVSRLMEEEGMFYYFAESEGAEKLIIADHPEVHEPLPCGADPVVPFRGEEGGLTGDVAVTQFAVRRSMRTGVVTLREFDFKKPALDLTVKKESPEDTTFEFYDYPGEYPDPAMGKTYAEIRLQQLRTGREIAEGAGNCRPFTPGFKFELAEYPRDVLNGEYLLTSVRHTGNQPSAAEEESEGVELGETAYTNTFFCIPATVPFRPRRRTPRPAVEGVQTAIVTGPSGEEIHVDEHGRVKVHFHWDREGTMDDKSSCWVRVSQAQTSGSMLLPRIGWEVIVDFIEGDPDRPIIIGRLHNPGEPGPYTLPAAKTQTSFKSSTSPGGGSGNELRFEDGAGGMEFFMNASKDMNVEVANNKSENVVVNSKRDVGVDDTETVGSNQDIDIGANQKLHVGGNQDETVDGNQTIAVSGNQKTTVSGTRDTNVNGKDTLVVGAAQAITIGATLEEKVGSSASQTVGTMMSVDAGVSIALTAGAMLNLTAAVIGAEAGSKLSISSGGSGEVSTSGPLKIKAGGPITIESSGPMTLKAPTIKVEGKSAVLIKGGGSQVKITGGGVVAKVSSIKLDGSGGVKIKGATVTQN